MARLPPELERHFRERRHCGEAPEGCVVGRAENLSCGDHLELALSIEGGRIVAVNWRGRGCAAVLAVASFASDALQDLPLDLARDFGLEARLERVGGLPPVRRHAIALFARALDEALVEHRRTCHS